MNIIWLFLGAFVIALGWYTGYITVRRLDEFVWDKIHNSAMVKKCKSKIMKSKKQNKNECCSETKIGF